MDAAIVAAGLTMTEDQLAAFLLRLLPEEFAPRPQTGATGARPGTFAKNNVMQMRAASHRSLDQPGDAGILDGRPMEREFVMLCRLKATEIGAARAEARQLLGRGRGIEPYGHGTSGGLPTGCSVEAV